MVDRKLKSLILKAKTGDQHAFEQIYRLHFEKIYRFVYFRVSHKEEAQDLAAETFIRAWNRLPDITDIEAFVPWIFQIARNLVIDFYRARKSTIDISTLENVLEYEKNIIEMVDLSLKQEEFLEALKNLTDDQQLVIKLKFLDDLDNDEIARILGKTEGAIRVIQHRAILELKKLLNQDD